ncbi:PREDICTED: zinc carboxypeptidase-like [Cyphomyrmex costatus]|uniref:zinc carboxypeptidase-like n=1 Tax=Cyphomyrmex costatus TaxID=456900 RepID=UPI0008522400|nr:PREDICTED: zinc carboxypeptidase-like [Cyphomyrmex costatus]
MWRIIAFSIVIVGLAAGKVSYEDYKVFSIYPTTQRQHELLRMNIRQFNYWFWKEPSWIDKEVQLMIPPHDLGTFYEIANIIGITYKLKINNVQKLIDNTFTKHQSKGFDFHSYHTLQEIYDDLEDLAKKYPKVEVVAPGETYEGRYIKGVEIINNVEFPGIFIEGGIHAKEWISPATVMYILHQLLTSEDQKVKSVANNFNWFIFPVFNPDGYEFTFNNTHGDRLWKKSRKPFNSSCIGADLNRNWGFGWYNVSRKDPCSDIYPGNKPYSEKEIKTMARYIRNRKHHFFAYVAFQSYGQLLTFPYGYTKERISNYDRLYQLGKRVIDVLKQRHNTKYEIGAIGEFYYDLQGGSSTDYVAGFLNKTIVYLYKLRDINDYGFLLPPEYIIPTGEETLDSLVAMINFSILFGYDL